MRHAFVALLALAGLSLATPASAQYWGHHHRHHSWHGHYGPGFGIYLGAPRYYGRGRCVRERIVRYRPNGRRVVRWVTRCY